MFFERLEKHLSHYRISRQDIWNMDEVGIHFNDMESNLPVWTLDLKEKASFGSSPDSRLVTVLECINTTGKSTPPLLISKGKHITEGQLPPDSILIPGDHLFLGKSDSAFTNSELTLAWLQQAFIPSSRRFTDGKEVWCYACARGAAQQRSRGGRRVHARDRGLTHLHVSRALSLRALHFARHQATRYAKPGAWSDGKLRLDRGRPTGLRAVAGPAALAVL